MEKEIHYFYKMKQTIILALLFLTMISCKSKDHTENTSIPPTPPSTTSAMDSLSPPAHDSSVASPPPATSAPEEKPLAPAKPKICDPDYTRLFVPKTDQYIYYVSGFNPDEFKCWVELENEGTRICGEHACIVYFMDSPNVKANKTPPHFMDDAALKQNGIGKFVFDGKYWEIKGAGQWKRQGNGYGYYNTNNQFGG